MAIDTDELEISDALSSIGEGYHQCWYPVALSSSLAPGDLLGTDFCDGRIVVYRGEDGEVHASTPYCKHMGSDLSIGQVVGNELQCSFHHWRYGPDGRCTAIPSGDRVPSSAKLTALPTAERWGIVWVFLGREPLYAVPDFVEWDPDTMVYRAFQIEFPEPLQVDPWVFASNAFDYQHLRVVHQSKLDADVDAVQFDDHSVRSGFEMDNPHGGKFALDLTLWGTNCLVSHGTHDGLLTQHIAAGTAMGTSGTQYFMAVAVPSAAASNRSPDEVEAELDTIQGMHQALLTEDLPIMNTLRMERNLFVSSDRVLARYFRYARRYARASIASLG